MTDLTSIGLAPCDWLLCAATAPETVDAYEALRTKTTWWCGWGGIRPAESSDDLRAARALWQDVTQGALLGDLCVVLVDGIGTAIVPYEVLWEAARELRRLRDAYRIAPPWLFCPDPCSDDPHESELEALRSLEDGAPTEADLASVGLTSCERGRAKYRWLFVARYRRLATDYAGRCLEQEIGPPPWLFGIPSRWQIPHPSEEAPLARLEAEAVVIDEAELALGDAPEPVALIARRRRFLRALQDAGFFRREMWDAKAHELHAWGFRELRGRIKASRQAIDYLESWERRKYNPDASELDVLEAPVCLDIFRGLRVPEGVGRFEWIAWGEHLLRTHGPSPDVSADSGEFPVHDGTALIVVHWRKDAEIPALRYLALVGST